MNELSWMIYLADVTGTLKVLLFIFIIIAAIILAWRIFTAALDSYGGLEKGEVWAPTKAALWIVGPASIMAAVLPSSSTIYAIAASEMGEKALNTETGGKAVKALNAWMDRQIEGEAK